MFCWCRFSNLPWCEHKLASDTVAMQRTEQILYLSVILNFLLQATTIPGPSRLLHVPCVVRAAGHPEIPRPWGSDVPTVPASSIHVAPRTVIASTYPPLGLDAQIRAAASQVSFTGRASMSSSIVREHDFLGAHTNHTEKINVHRQLHSRQLLSLIHSKFALHWQPADW